ncbi:MAG: SCO family protein [Acidobacteriota bacterium]
MSGTKSRGELYSCGIITIMVVLWLSVISFAKTNSKITRQKGKTAIHQTCHKNASQPNTSQPSKFRNATIPDVEVIDQDGKTWHFFSDLILNEQVAINFIYTTCEALCPMQAKTFSNIQAELENQPSNLKLISISIDPENDSPEKLKNWASQFNAKPGWTFLTGKKSEIEKLLKAMIGDSTGFKQHASIMFIGNAKADRWEQTFSFAPPNRVFEILKNLSKPEY